MNIKLAEALLRRKELQAKVDQLHTILPAQLYELKVARRNINETVDDITAQVPRLNAAQVTSEYDFYARQLRLVDAAIQQANWTTTLEVGESVMADWSGPAAVQGSTLPLKK
jgi:hypothetical protein